MNQHNFLKILLKEDLKRKLIYEGSRLGEVAEHKTSLVVQTFKLR